MARYLQKYYHNHHHSGSKLSKKSCKATPTSSVANSSPFHHNMINENPTVAPPNEFTMMKVGWWIIDLTLSFAGAVMVATVATNQEELFMTLGQLPRVLPDDESRIADTLCPPAMSMLQDIKKNQKRRSDDDDDAAAQLLESPPQSVVLQATMDFTRACQQRKNRNEFFARRKRAEWDNDVVNDGDADDDVSLFGTSYQDVSTTSNWDDTTRS
jgi:hypothetical protein